MKLGTANLAKIIAREGAMLVYPEPHNPRVPSLWKSLFPRKKMIWEWTEESDSHVADLWHARARLMESRKCVYLKWYQNRATFFSPRLFTALLSLVLHHFKSKPYPFKKDAFIILDVLENNSPLSTRQLKRESNLEGRFFDGTFQSSIRQLFRKFLIVGCGEVDDGAFPSLSFGATQLIFEEIWLEAHAMNVEKARKVLEGFPSFQAFRPYFERVSLSKPMLTRR